MATVKKGTLTPPGEWADHLRWLKRAFWKSERMAAKRDVEGQAADGGSHAD